MAMRFVCSETRNPPPKVDSEYEEEDEDESSEEEEQEDVEDYKKGRQIFPKLIPVIVFTVILHSRQVLWKYKTANRLNYSTGLLRVLYFPRPINRLNNPFPLGRTSRILSRFVSECCIINCAALGYRFNFKPSLPSPSRLISFVRSCHVDFNCLASDFCMFWNLIVQVYTTKALKCVSCQQ